MLRRPPRSTRTDTLFPYTTLFRSRQEEVKRAHIARRGGLWSTELDPMLKLQPDLLDAYSGYYTVPSNRGALDELTRELIYITIDRSEERRVGKECVRTCRSRWWPDH